MERLTERIENSIRVKGCSTVYPPTERKSAPLQSAIARLAAYEDMMERWRLRDIAEAENIFRRVNALDGTDKMAEYKMAIDSIVHCRDCKHLYSKDFEAYCPHRVGACKPDGFCERGGKRGDT